MNLEPFIEEIGVVKMGTLMSHLERSRTDFERSRIRIEAEKNLEPQFHDSIFSVPSEAAVLSCVGMKTELIPVSRFLHVMRLRYYPTRDSKHFHSGKSVFDSPECSPE